MRIAPVKIWKDGREYTAEMINVYGTHDDFKTTATVFYGLYEMATPEPTEEKSGMPVLAPGTMLSSGNVIINGEDYLTWGDTGDVNAEIFAYVAGKLGLTIVPEITEPEVVTES
jgi:hypothetical protein